MMDHSLALNSFEPIYDSSSEKELIKMWSDITGKNIESLNKNLMKAMVENEEQIKDVKDVMYLKQMWDSEKASWVPFDLWGAHFIVNQRKESLALRIYRPCDIQPEFGPAIKGWHSLDSSYLNEKLKEDKDSFEKYKSDLFKSFSGYQAFYVMVRQDREEYEREGRINEFSHTRRRNK